jgi:hypothetical protein
MNGQLPADAPAANRLPGRRIRTNDGEPRQLIDSASRPLLLFPCRRYGYGSRWDSGTVAPLYSGRVAQRGFRKSDPSRQAEHSEYRWDASSQEMSE